MGDSNFTIFKMTEVLSDHLDKTLGAVDLNVSFAQKKKKEEEEIFKML